MKLFKEINDPNTILELNNIENQYQIKLPPKYRLFFEKYYPYNEGAEFNENIKRIYYIDVFSLKIISIYFPSLDEIKSQFENNFEDDEDEFGWKLIPFIRCGSNPHAGFYVGYGDNNMDVVYYVDEEGISPNFKPPLDTEKLPSNITRSIARVAKDALSFLEFLCQIPIIVEEFDYDNLK